MFKKIGFLALLFSGAVVANGAEIASPQVVDFANNSMRTLANDLTKTEATLTVIKDTYDARNLGTIISDAGAGNLIADGSALDGRTRRTGGDVFNMVTFIDDFNAFLDQNGRRELLHGWQVNALQ